ncbi:MAG TPA: hypothetical protein VGE27_04215 [Gemmatimonas sp.]|uniref:hypothetical protein n=1 Tax=Gemmatimonas sp. TaxID=1962908 RepID=UPI002ED8417C
MPRYRAYVEIDGLIAVHAVRAVWTALTAVPGILSAEVSMTGAVLELEAPVDRDALAAALAMAGVTLRDVRQERGTLPLLPGDT